MRQIFVMVLAFAFQDSAERLRKILNLGRQSMKGSKARTHDCKKTLSRETSVRLLHDLMDHYGSDKGSLGHNYTHLYGIVLRGLRCTIRKVLEVGIGSQNPHGPGSMHQALRSARPDKTIHHYRPGASLRAWRDSMLFLIPS